MRLNTSTSTLLVLFTIIKLGLTLPFFPRRSPTEELARRATYSVVPVDGGPVQTDAPEETVVETIIQTQPPRTKTVVQTDNVILPPVTDYILTTKTINGPKETHVVVVTVTPEPPVATATSYSIIDVDASSTTTILATASPSASSTPTVSIPRPTASQSTSQVPASGSNTVPASTPTQTQTSVTSETQYTSTFTTFSSTWSSSTPVITSSSTSTTKSFDDGLWKTYYPAWNDTRTAGMWIREPKATASPELRATPVMISSVKDSLKSRSLLARFSEVTRRWFSKI